MKMLTLPNGTIINPAHVKSVSTHPHLLSRSKSYVQLDMKRGADETIAEKITPEAAEEIRTTYLRLIEAACNDVNAYCLGYDDGKAEGYEIGQSDGYKRGWTDGHNEGHESGRATGYEDGSDDGYLRGRQDAHVDAYGAARTDIVQELSGMRDELLREQVDARALGPDRRRYIKHSILLLTNLIRRFLPPSEDGGQ